MPSRGVSRFVPLFVTIALIAALGAVYGPGIVRAWKFRTTVNAMLADIQAGNVRKIPNYVVPEQKAEIAVIVMSPIVAHYAHDVGKLKLTSYYREDNHVWALVTAKEKDGSGIGQGKLRWIWDGKQWRFDALSSYVGAGLISDDDNAMSIGDMIRHATRGKDFESMDNPFAQ